MSHAVNNIDMLEFDNITYTMPKKATGHYSVCAHHNDTNGVSGGKMYFQTPRMKVQHDMVNGDGDTAHFLDVSCDDEAFVKGVQELDERVFNVIKEKRSEWFPNKTIDDTFLEVGQTQTMMKNSVVRAHVDRHVQIFDTEKTPISPESITKDSTVRCILQFVGIWFTANRWGVTLKIVQMLHYPSRPARSERQPNYGYMFPDEEAVDDQPDDETPVPPPGV